MTSVRRARAMTHRAAPRAAGVALALALIGACSFPWDDYEPLEGAGGATSASATTGDGSTGTTTGATTTTSTSSTMSTGATGAGAGSCASPIVVDENSVTTATTEGQPNTLDP